MWAVVSMRSNFNALLLENYLLSKSRLLQIYAMRSESIKKIGLNRAPARMLGIGEPIGRQAREFLAHSKHLWSVVGRAPPEKCEIDDAI